MERLGHHLDQCLDFYLLLSMFLIICNFQVKFTGFRKLVLRLNIARIVKSDCYLLIPHIPCTLHSLHLVLTLGTPCTYHKRVKGSHQYCKGGELPLRLQVLDCKPSIQTSPRQLGTHHTLSSATLEWYPI